MLIIPNVEGGEDSRPGYILPSLLQLKEWVGCHFGGLSFFLFYTHNSLLNYGVLQRDLKAFFDGSLQCRLKFHNKARERCALRPLFLPFA